MAVGRKQATVAGVVALVAALALSTLSVSATAQTTGTAALPRAATLYTSGTAWGPFTNFNPLRSGYATGVLGLLYETLFRYDPLKDRFIPWLATSGRWEGTTYALRLRPGVIWNDGRPMTGADVKFTFETGKLDGSEISTLWKTGLQRVTTSGSTVRFVFKGTPNYQDWDFRLYSVPIVPRHVWSSYTPTEITTGNADETSKMVGTGPFTYGAGKGSSQTLQWDRREGWWATKALGMRMPMKHIVDIHNTQNTASLQNFLQNRIDLSNNFFPGVDKVIGGKVATYYAKPPYMLAANTAWLVPNTTKKPLNDKAFRRALATSIDINRIVKDDYGNIVSKASPTGLLPTWSKWIDQAQAKRLGFTYSTSRAKSILQGAGYRDTNGDGFVENKDGSKIDLRIIVPNGWSDWMTAIQMISASAKDAGIRVTPAYPDFNGLVDERNSGKFDLVLNNEKQIGNTPYTYYDYLFHLPVAESQTFANFSRFTEAGARPWALTLKLNKTKTTDVRKAKAIHSQIQRVILEDLPAIPLWYNGMWSQYNTTVWTSFPAEGTKQQYTPTVWNGYLNMTGIDALANLKLKK